MRIRPHEHDACLLCFPRRWPLAVYREHEKAVCRRLRMSSRRYPAACRKSRERFSSSPGTGKQRNSQYRPRCTLQWCTTTADSQSTLTTFDPRRRALRPLQQGSRNCFRSRPACVERDPHRGFDHGTFVPLALMYPNADVPVVMLSLKSTPTTPKQHIRVGPALSPTSQRGCTDPWEVV